MPKVILTVREVAEFLRVTERTIYRPAPEGLLPSFKVSGSWRFRRSNLTKWKSDQARSQSSSKRRSIRKQAGNFGNRSQQKNSEASTSGRNSWHCWYP